MRSRKRACHAKSMLSLVRHHLANTDVLSLPSQPCQPHYLRNVWFARLVGLMNQVASQPSQCMDFITSKKNCMIYIFFCAIVLNHKIVFLNIARQEVQHCTETISKSWLSYSYRFQNLIYRTMLKKNYTKTVSQPKKIIFNVLFAATYAFFQLCANQQHNTLMCIKYRSIQSKYNGTF